MRLAGLGAEHTTTLSSLRLFADVYMDVGCWGLALPMLRELLATRCKVAGRQHESTALAENEVGACVAHSGDYAGARAHLESARAALAALYGDDSEHPVLLGIVSDIGHMDGMLADPRAAGRVRRLRRKKRAEAAAAAVATVVGLSSRPELNGSVVQIQRHLSDKGWYAVRCLAAPGADGGGPDTAINLKPANLRLAAGCRVVVAGLEAAAELNGLEGVVAGFDGKKGRYWVRLDGIPQPKGLRPTSCVVFDHWWPGDHWSYKIF